MKYLKYLLISIVPLMTACSSNGAFDYDQDVSLCNYSIHLYYMDKNEMISAPAGLPVEMRDQMAIIFSGTTDASGCAHFQIPAGIYEASSSSNYIGESGSDKYRYIFNGVQSMIVISPDKSNEGQLKLTMSKKRIVN
jgi:hypothetical protein